MPLASYTFVHRDTKLSPDEVTKICDWTENTRKQLAAAAPSHLMQFGATCRIRAAQMRPRRQFCRLNFCAPAVTDPRP